MMRQHNAPEMKRDKFSDLILAASMSTTIVAFFATLILHLGLRLSWSELVFPLAMLVVLYAAFFVGLLWAARHKSVRMGAPIAGAFFAALSLMVAHYGSRWRLRTGFYNKDAWEAIALISAIVIALTLMPRQWIENWNDIKCSRCGHYHEGRDCRCGCRIDQFKYPPFQFP